MVPSSETTKDITGWVPVANATVTLTDSEGVTHTVTTDEDGYYTFTDIAVNANTIITATATIDGNTVIIKDVIPQAVAATEDYDAETADAESTALGLIVEELLEQGLDPEDINLEEIQDSDNFTEVAEQVSTVLEENGNVTTDPDVTETVSNAAEDIITPPVYTPPEEPTEELPEEEYVPTPTPVNHAPSITSEPVTTVTVDELYTYDVNATDPDGDTLTYSLTTSPTGMTIDSATGVISWTPTSEGDYAVVVMVSDGALNDTQNFTITVSVPELTHIVVLPKTMTLFVGEGDSITSIIASYNYGPDASIALAACSYSSDSESVATVATGVVTGVGAGSATITVSYTEGGITKEDTVAVTVNPVLLDYIIVLPETMTLFEEGETDNITSINAHYNNGAVAPIDPGNCTITSDNPAVAIVDAFGIVTSVVPGTATITVSYAGKTDTVEVTVKVAIVMDGILSPGEWDSYFWFTDNSEGPGTGYDDDSLPIFTGYLYFDEDNLCLAFDVEDTTPDTNRDFLYVTLDIPPAMEFNDPIDALYWGSIPTNVSFFGEAYLTGDDFPWDRSQRSSTWGTDGGVMTAITITATNRYYELRIPLTAISAILGDTIGIKIQARGGISEADPQVVNYFPDMPDGIISAVRADTRVEVEGNFCQVTLTP